MPAPAEELGECVAVDQVLVGRRVFFCMRREQIFALASRLAELLPWNWKDPPAKLAA